MVCSLPGSITRVLIQYRVVLEYERELRCFLNPSFPASFEVRTQTACGHSNMTRPLAAGGFFVALVPAEPFLRKCKFFLNLLTWENTVFRF